MLDSVLQAGFRPVVGNMESASKSAAVLRDEITIDAVCIPSTNSIQLYGIAKRRQVLFTSQPLQMFSEEDSQWPWAARKPHSL